MMLLVVVSVMMVGIAVVVELNTREDIPLALPVGYKGGLLLFVRMRMRGIVRRRSRILLLKPHVQQVPWLSC